MSKFELSAAAETYRKAVRHESNYPGALIRCEGDFTYVVYEPAPTGGVERIYAKGVTASEAWANAYAALSVGQVARFSEAMLAAVRSAAVAQSPVTVDLAQTSGRMKRSKDLRVICYLIGGKTVTRDKVPYAFAGAAVCKIGGRYFIPSLPSVKQSKDEGIDLIMKEVTVANIPDAVEAGTAQQKANIRAGRRATASAMIGNFKTAFEQRYARECTLHDDVLFALIDGAPSLSTREEHDAYVVDLIAATQSLWTDAGVRRT